jgi:hypothetical protein
MMLGFVMATLEAALRLHQYMIEVERPPVCNTRVTKTYSIAEDLVTDGKQ